MVVSLMRWTKKWGAAHHCGSAGASPSPKKQGQQIGVVIANRYGFSRLLTPREWPLPGSLINAVGRAFPAGARQYL